jgi:hypothetical protein
MFWPFWLGHCFGYFLMNWANKSNLLVTLFQGLSFRAGCLAFPLYKKRLKVVPGLNALAYLATFSVTNIKVE